MFKKTKRILSGLVAMSMMALLTTGCGNTNSNEIKIGANLEMTGNTATFGQSATNGAKLAIKQVNAKGGVLGKQITLVVADNKSDTAPAVHTPVNPINIGIITKHGTNIITCLNKLKNIDIFTFPID